MTVGARDSNAGDQFHFLWSARKAMQLIRPGTSLQLLKVEGVTPVDAVNGRDGQDQFLAADVTEYHGGVDFATAARVVISQLKYSVRKPQRAWTVARLTARDGNKKSVLRKLADAYRGFVAGRGASAPASVLRLQLVSNQPAAELLAKQTSHPQRPADKVLRKAWTRLQQASGLPVREFSDFLTCLDFSACGVGSRELQHVALLQELGRSVTNPTTTARELCQLIVQHALPETAQHPGLRREDVLAWLNVADEDRIFPAKPRWTTIDSPIATPAAAEIASRLAGKAARHLVAHGPAGVGKTTTLQMIDAELPAGSVLLLFDCYGHGTYEQPGESRHTHQRALVQLINELAVRCSTPLLLQAPTSNEDLIRRFRQDIEAASTLLPTGALLVLAIDAADNSVTAARGSSDCFVPTLWQLPLPDNVRLLMSCRSHRRDSLKAPSNTPEYVLKGFDSAASGVNLRRTFSSAQPRDVDSFHTQTAGNPRVQFYKLQAAAKAAASLSAMLAAASKTPMEMFDDLLQAAAGRAGTALGQLAELLVLTRPTPLAVLSQLGGAKLQSLAQALEPGITIENGCVALRDEDFETFLRDQVNAEALRAAHERIARAMTPLEPAHDYSARHIADHLYYGGLHGELLALALGPNLAPAIADPFIRLQTRRRRVSLGLQAAAAQGNAKAIFQFVLTAAELNKTEGALYTLTQSNPDLAARYADIETVRRLLLRGNSRWQGPAHAHLAVIFSRRRAYLARGQEHRRLLRAWLRKRWAQPEEERHHWPIDDDMLARAAEALYWLEGPAAALEWFSSWRPRLATMGAFDSLVDGLVEHAGATELLSHWDSTGLPPLGQAVFLGRIARWGGLPPPAKVRRLALLLSRHPRYFGRYAGKLLPAAADFIELAARSKASPRTITRLIAAVDWQGPRHRVHAPPDVRGHDPFIRMRTLSAALAGKEFSVDDLRPPPDQQNASGRDDYELRHSFDDVFGRVIYSYQWRGKLAARRCDGPQIIAAAQAFIDTAKNPEPYLVERGDWYLRINADNFSQVLRWQEQDPAPLLESFAKLAEARVFEGRAEVWMTMAESCLDDPRTAALGWRLLEAAADALEHGSMPAKERWEKFLQCAAIAARHDLEQGRTYYERAREAAQDIDDDQIPLLTLQSSMAEGLAGRLPPERAGDIARQLTATVEAHADLVSDNDQLPWDRAASAAFAIDLSAGLEQAAGWNASKRARFDTTLPRGLRSALQSNHLTAREALALLELANEWTSPVAIGLLALEKAAAKGDAGRAEFSEILARLVEWIRRDLPVSNRAEAARELLAGCDSRNLRAAGLAPLRDLVAFEESLVAHDRYASPSTHFSRRESKPTVTKRRPPKPSDHVKVFRYATRLANGVYTTSEANEYLLRTGRNQLPANRIAFLDALIESRDDDRIDRISRHVHGVLLREWRGIAAVQGWIKSHQDVIVERAIREDEYRSADTWIQELHDLMARMGLALSPAIGRVTAVQLPRLSPQALFNLAAAVWRELAPAAQEELMGWMFAQSHHRLREVGRTVPSPAPRAASPNPERIAQFLFVTLGHPDRYVRWRALHAARTLCLHEAYTDRFVSLLGSTETHGFIDSRQPFYEMSARSFLAYLMLNLAEIRPALLRTHAPVLANLALDPAFPHAVLRETTKLACERLLASHPDCLPVETARRLAVANAPRSCAFPRGQEFAGTHGWEAHGTGADRFDFNPIDTLPYWFEPAARTFGVSMREFCAAAERWICDQWHWTKEELERFHRSDPSRHDWQLTHNDHGAIPRIETLRLYLEYHAMQCVSGEMADTIPIKMSKWETDDDDWHRRLGYLFGATPSHWLSDLRQPTPHIPHLWGWREPTATWLWRKTKADYNEALGLQPRKALPAFLTVAGFHGFGDSDRDGSVRVESALVVPELARSLLYSLQSAKVSADAPIRTVVRDDDEEEEGVAVDDSGFKLQPWLDRIVFKSDWQDHDPHAHEFSGQFHSLLSDFVSRHQLSVRNWEWFTPAGERVAYSERWSDYRLGAERRSRSLASGGERLRMATTLILAHLRATGLDLILKVTLARNQEYELRRANKKDQYDLGTPRIYLLRQSGVLEVVGSHRYAG